MDNLRMKINKLNMARGISAIEVMIVGIITAIIITVAVVNFRGVMQSSLLENTAQKVISFLHYAQTYSVTKWRQIIVEILPDEKMLVMKLDEQESKEFILPNKFSMESDVSKLMFDYSGSFDLYDANDPKNMNKLTGKITVIDDEARKADIDLWGFGGYIRIKSKHFSKLPPG
jgi:type II secretory pathway pseudopilin PulG